MFSSKQGCAVFENRTWNNFRAIVRSWANHPFAINQPTADGAASACCYDGWKVAWKLRECSMGFWGRIKLSIWKRTSFIASLQPKNDCFLSSGAQTLTDLTFGSIFQLYAGRFWQLFHHSKRNEETLTAVCLSLWWEEFLLSYGHLKPTVGFVCIFVAGKGFKSILQRLLPEQTIQTPVQLHITLQPVWRITFLFFLFFCSPYIIDLDSTNGTYINNERLNPSRYYELKEQVSPNLSLSLSLSLRSCYTCIL